VAGDLGKRQLEGEYIGMKKLYQSAPELVVKPIAWGQLNEIPACYFLLMEFKSLVLGLPDPVKLGRNLAMMHKRSESPTGMFGFEIQTYDGARPQAVAWDPSWTSFFLKLLAEAFRQDKETNGVWPEMERVFARVQSHLIPRLLGALESDGRLVRPCLIHGDLWDGNVATDAENNDPVIFDCGAYYAHNEMELGIWRAERHELKAEIFRLEYLRNFEASEPKQEWEDRNLLYSTKTNLMFSACYAGSRPRKL
jgi:fructosamine-3-kinase